MSKMLISNKPVIFGVVGSKYVQVKDTVHLELVVV